MIGRNEKASFISLRFLFLGVSEEWVVLFLWREDGSTVKSAISLFRKCGIAD